MNCAPQTTTPSPDAEREAKKSYADALFQLAATDMHGVVKIAQAALVQYSDGWRLVAQFDGLDDKVRMTSYCIDPVTVLENCRVVNARAERAEAARDELRAERDAALAREARLREALEPFKAIAKQWKEWADAWEGQPHEPAHAGALKLGDFLRIHAALASTSEPQPAAEGE